MAPFFFINLIFFLSKVFIEKITKKSNQIENEDALVLKSTENKTTRTVVSSSSSTLFAASWTTPIENGEKNTPDQEVNPLNKK